MVLKSSRIMPRLTCTYCGVAWYFSNSACHAAAESGGTVPAPGSHSTIDRPDSVSRVAPPTSTMTNTKPAMASSHSLIAHWCNPSALRPDVMRSPLATNGADHIDRPAASQSAPCRGPGPPAWFETPAFALLRRAPHHEGGIGAALSVDLILRSARRARLEGWGRGTPALQ